jgi:hypothetical protein
MHPLSNQPKTCRNCAWYVPREDHTRSSCGSPKILYGYGRGFAEGDELHVEYDEEWGMSPGPDFGCVHWEECDET